MRSGSAACRAARSGCGCTRSRVQPAITCTGPTLLCLPIARVLCLRRVDPGGPEGHPPNCSMDPHLVNWRGGSRLPLRVRAASPGACCFVCGHQPPQGQVHISRRSIPVPARGVGLQPGYPSSRVTTADILSTIARAVASSLASAMTRTIGSVPDTLTRTRPLSPSSASAAFTAS